MIRTWRTGAWAALLAGAFAVLHARAQESQPAGQPQFRSTVDVFLMDVSVLDDKRQPVSGLSRDDFTILEEGKPQQVVSFSEVTFPVRDRPLYASEEVVAPDLQRSEFSDRRLFCLVIDDFGMNLGPGGFGSQAMALNEVKRVAREFIENLGPLDLAAVQFTKDTRYYPDFTNRYFKLMDAIQAFSPPGEAERAALEQMTGGRVGLMPALAEIVPQMAKLPQHRKSIVYVGIGNPYTPSITGGNSELMGTAVAGARQITRLAAREGIPISSLNVNGDLQTAVGPLPRSADFLRMLADDTGGFAGVGWQQAEKSVQQLFAETQSYYLIGYQRDVINDGRTRSLEVRLRPRGLRAYARRGYVAPGKDDMVARAPAPAFDQQLDAAIKRLEAGDDRETLARASLASQGGWVSAPVVLHAAMSPRASFAPSTDMTFPRSERIRVEWQMLRPTDTRRIRLLRRAGDALAFVPGLTVSDTGGQPTLTTEFPMNSLAPGTYIVELTVGDGPAPDRSLVAFRVAG